MAILDILRVCVCVCVFMMRVCTCVCVCVCICICVCMFIYARVKYAYKMCFSIGSCLPVGMFVGVLCQPVGMLSVSVLLVFSGVLICSYVCQLECLSMLFL